jgi:two-component system KDP operon response regulator KdpE
MSDAWKILLIEDEPQMRRFLRTSLGTTAHTLVEAPTGCQGLAIAAEQKPDVILLDLGLPDMDGLEVIKTRLARSTPEPMTTSRSHSACQSSWHAFVLRVATPRWRRSVAMPS